MIPTIEIRSSWIVERGYAYEIGDKHAARRARLRLGDESPRPQAMRERLATHGTTTTSDIARRRPKDGPHREVLKRLIAERASRRSKP